MYSIILKRRGKRWKLKVSLTKYNSGTSDKNEEIGRMDTYLETSYATFS